MNTPMDALRYAACVLLVLAVFGTGYLYRWLGLWIA